MNPAATSTPQALHALVQFYETLSPASLANIEQVYDTQVRFTDPFNDVQGMPAMRTIFEHMFAATQNPRFVVLSAFASVDGSQAFLRWDFHFGKAGLGQEVCIHGSSYVNFNIEGKVVLHQDYWDTGKELFAKMPLFGGLIRWLYRQLKTPQCD